jgi:hypothetical protein
MRTSMHEGEGEANRRPGAAQERRAKELEY